MISSRSCIDDGKSDGIESFNIYSDGSKQLQKCLNSSSSNSIGGSDGDDNSVGGGDSGEKDNTKD